MKINLILGGRANALAIARSLNQPESTFVIDFPKRTICSSSRFVSRYFQFSQNESLIVDSLNRLFANDKAVLFPTDDFWVDFLARKQSQLSKNLLYFKESAEKINCIVDKLEFYNSLVNDVNVPETRLWNGIAKEGYFVKPRKPFLGLTIVDKGLNCNYKVHWQEEKESFIEQRFISAPLNRHLSVCGLSLNGRITAHTVSCKLFEYPSPGGTATMCCSSADINLNNKLLNVANRIIERLDYSGIFEIEFVYAENTVWVIELNPRFWLQHEMPTKMGLNFSILYRDALLDTFDNPILSENISQEIVYWIHEGLLLDIFRVEVIKKLYAALKNKHVFAYWSTRDLRPFLAFLRAKLLKN